jgi:hypothetical protein
VSDPVRSRQARDLAEGALVRLVAAYGEMPEFVLLGGLVPDLLYSGAANRHIGTTAVVIQRGGQHLTASGFGVGETRPHPQWS